MLSWFRSQSRGIASAALAALVALTLSSAAPHSDDCHGAECGAIVPHDASSHGVGRPEQSTDLPIHCVLCHITRSVRPTPETAQLLAPSLTGDVSATLDVFSSPSQTALAQPSLRGPPASLSFV
jgi:hypothetical protein